MGEVEGIGTLELERLRLHLWLIGWVAIGQVTYLWASLSSSMKWGEEKNIYRVVLGAHDLVCMWRVGSVIIAQLITSPLPLSSSQETQNNSEHTPQVCFYSQTLLSFPLCLLSKSLLGDAFSLFYDILPLPFPSLVWAYVRCVHVHMKIHWETVCSVSCQSNSTQVYVLQEDHFLHEGNKIWHLPSIGKIK